MASAYEVVERLHEGVASSTPRALFFVPGLLPGYNGLFVIAADPFASFVEKIHRIHPKLAGTFIGNPEAAVSFLIEHHNLLAVVRYGDEVSVYCRKQRNKMPTQALASLADSLQVFNSTPVGWFPNLQSDPIETTGAVTFYGEAPRKVPKTPKPKAPKRETAEERRTRFWAKGSTDLPTLDDVDKIVGGGT